MSAFTLVISCLGHFHLPWFMDLTFQVPMQYCSLQHRTLLLSPVRFTAECCFCFGSVFSFFLDLFLHWSPVVYWASRNGNPLQYSCLENSMHWEAPQSLVGYSPWGRKESDTTEQLNWTEHWEVLKGQGWISCNASAIIAVLWGLEDDRIRRQRARCDSKSPWSSLTHPRGALCTSERNK